jgi:N-methylhydantoinase A
MTGRTPIIRALDATTWIIGVDIGGTFTDATAIDADGSLYTAKALTTPSDPVEGVLAAVEELAAVVRLSAEELLAATTKFAHGTTATVNAMVQRRGAKTGLITTKGFRDHLVVMNAQRGRGLPKFERRDLARVRKPEPLVPLELTRDVTERVDYAGLVVVPLNETEGRRAVQELLEAGIETLTVSLLWSFKNPAHEQRLREITRELAPELFVTLSSELAPVIGEYERTFTAVANSFLAPSLSRYVESLQRRLGERGLRYPVLLMQSFGGLIPATEAPKQAITTLVSGLAGGVIGAQHVGEMLGLRNLITADMGGTSFEVGMVHDGQPLIESHPFAPRLGPYIGRWTLSVPTLDITAIGSGGGSIAWVDDGVLKVGPLSAQAVPGPACYGRGGTQPTVTDADLALGFLNPGGLLGGSLQPDRGLAEAAIREYVAEPLGLNVEDAALGIVEVANSQMADLMRKLTVERGYDPREFTLVAFGGAGPVHIGAFGPRMGITRMLVPGRGLASAFSALGIAMADVRRSYSLSSFMQEPFDLSALSAVMEELESQGRRSLDEWGIAPYQMRFRRAADMRFTGQAHTVTVPWPSGAVDLAAIQAAFVRAYEASYGVNTAHPEAGSEITTFRLEAIGDVAKPVLRMDRGSDLRRAPEGGKGETLTLALSQGERGSRRVRFAGGEVDAAVFDGDELVVGECLEGPAVVDYPGTTVVVYPGQRASVDRLLNIVLEQVA